MGAHDGCYAQVYLDDALVFSPQRGQVQQPLIDISRFATSDIEALEFYEGPAQTPARYSNLNSTCGVLVIHTRRTP
jgi:hypothetical protein